MEPCPTSSNGCSRRVRSGGLFLYGAAIFGFRYLAFAGLAFAEWYGRRIGQRRGKLQGSMPGLPQLAREIAYSVATVLIFGLVGGVISGYGIAPHTQLYHDVAQDGWTYFWLSIPLMVLVRDAYFYWTHRLMHTRALFRTFHAVHHLSTNPTPWTAYAFHPLESVVQALGVVLILFIMPSHPLGELDLGGVYVNYSPKGRNGWGGVDLTVIGANGKLLR